MSRILQYAFRLLTIGVACSLYSSVAFGWCDPKIDRSVKGEFSHSVYVASVRVTGVVWLDDSKFRRPVKLKQPLMLGNIPGGFDPYSGANYRVEVLKTFKGKPKRNLTIFSENTEARTPLDVGKSYLVFLQRGTVLGGPPESKANDLMIDYCGNSSHLENAQQIIRVIARN